MQEARRRREIKAYYLAISADEITSYLTPASFDLWASLARYRQEFQLGARWLELGGGMGDLAAAALDRGWLRLCVAEVDGAPAAAYYGLRQGGAEWYYQLGRDPRWDDQRVGWVLLLRMLREAFDDGVGTFRFGVGAEDYKQRLAETDPGVETLILSTRLATRVAPQVATGARRLPPGARRPVMRVLGW